MTEALRDLLSGRGAHVDPVACLQGLNAELAGRRLAGAEHTIWQLLVHLNFWMDYELRSIAGPEAPYPEHAAASWPREDAPSDETAWSRERARFEAQLKQLDRLAQGNAAALAALVHPKKGETLQLVLWQMVAHNSYHTGQIALLRRAFGAWPPPGGGDTW